MKILLSLVLLCSSASPALAEDNELLYALRHLQHRVHVCDRSTASNLIHKGEKVYYVGAAGLTLLALWILPFRRGLPIELSPLTQLSADVSAYFLGGGAVLMIAGYMTRPKLPETREMQASSVYKSPEGLNEFFKLTLEQQYLVAANDVEFAKFLIDLNSAYELIEKNQVLP